MKSLYALFFSGSVLAFVGLGYWLSSELTYDGRLKIFYNSPNELAMYLSIMFLVGTVLFLKARENREKFFIIFGLMLILVNLFLTLSFAAWAGAGLSFGVMIILLKPKRFFKIIIATFAILVLAFVSQAGSKKIHNLLLENGRSSLDSRIQVWKASGLMIKGSPIFGIGPANFQNKYLEYQKYFPPYLEWAVPQPHNMYLAFWLEAGLLGFVGFIGLIMKFFVDNKKAITSDRLIGALCASLMVYFLIHGSLDTTYWRNDMAVLFWMMVSLNIYVARFSNQPSLERSL
jgi:putative inorganic carbon (hco3(-)) transporter